MSKKYKSFEEEFAALSNEYKHLQPTTESTLAESESPSKTESFLRGAAQGASFGFSDEATAALESAAGSLGLVPDKTYQQALEESQADYKAAEEANPYTYGAGGIAGGIGTTALGGAALRGLGLLKKASDIAKGEQAVSKIMPALKLIGTGAGEGALYGAGSAEQGERLKGAKEGAASGFIVGAAIPAAGKVLKTAGEALGQTSQFQKLKDIFNISKSGRNLLSKEVRDELEREAEKSAKSVTDSLQDTLSKTGELKSSILSKIPLETSMAKSELDKTLQEISPFLKTEGNIFPEAQKLKFYIDNTKEFLNFPNLTVNDLSEYTEKLYKQLKTLPGIQGANQEVIHSANNLVKNLRSIYKDIRIPLKNDTLFFTKFKSVNDLDRKMAEIYNTSKILTGKKLSDFKSEAEKLAALQKITKFLAGQEAETQTGKMYRSKINAITDILKESNPELASKISDLSKETSKIAQASRVVTGQQLPGEVTNTSLPFFSRIAATPVSMAGSAVGKAGKIVGSVTDTTLKAINHITPQQYQAATAKYGKATADKLKEFAVADVATKKSLINVIMQRPELRQAFAELFPGYSQE